MVVRFLVSYLIKHYLATIPRQGNLFHSSGIILINIYID